MIKKITILAIFSFCLGCAIYKDNEKQINKRYHLYRLNKELKDVYSHSKYYEKMVRHGLSVPESKWEELHEKANNIKAEISFIKSNY